MARLAMIACLLAACVDAPLDPVGSYSVTFVWGAGSCGLTGTARGNYLVSDLGGDRLVINDVDEPTASIQGGILCSDTCTLTFTEIATVAMQGNTARVTLQNSWILDENHAVTGSGSTTVQPTIGAACNQGYSLTGSGAL